jgi:hypothetical protein
MVLDTVIDAVDSSLIWQGMDNVSDLEEQDQDATSEASFHSLDQDSDSDAELDSDDPYCHPILEPVLNADNSANLDEDDSFTSSAADLPEVVQKLQKQLLSGYTPPNHPPIIDLIGRPLTSDEMLSLKHYLAWVDSHGTVKAYGLHAKVLEETTGAEILSLYKVRKLAMELSGLSSQLVDMCPKSCMAFTGDFKDLHSCIYVRDKCHGPCGQPRYDRKGHPRAQMIYTPIAPVIQSFYMNKEMAEAMRYRHRHLQGALQGLKPDSSPTKYSDFPDSINHLNQFHHSHLFQQETDTAITISGDGVQLTMKKKSDVWVLVVTILNLPPDMRSKAANIIMPLVIPGPSSPGNVESFVYVLYEELAKLSVGVWTKDALSGNYFLLRVYLCGVLGDMLGSAKLSRMAGHMAAYGCRFSTVRGARPSKDKGMISYHSIMQFILLCCFIGAKPQYYPLSPPLKNGVDINEDRPHFDPFNLPIRTIEDYWKTIERLEAVKGTKKHYSDAVKDTGVSGLPICAASPAFSHPFFFPLDPFHLFYENCMPHFWDTWITFSTPEEIVYMDQEIGAMLGAEAEKAIATLPSSFCGPIRNPYTKRQSQYKIYEWMALLHMYIVPMAWELKFNVEVVKNFALFSNVVEYAMTTVPRTEEDLSMLLEKIILFLRGFESLYVGNDASKITRCRLCIFQLIYIPFHITYNGSIRFGSQATCERAIGDIGHGIRSRKSPFQNIVSYKGDKQSVRLIHLIYPTLSSSKARVQRTSLFKSFPITQRQRREDNNIKAQIEAIHSYLGAKVDPSFEIRRWGKCPLPNNITLTSQLFELSKKSNSRTSRYFEAHPREGLQPRDQPIDETEVEVERIKPIFGEALAFYTTQSAEGTNLSLVVYCPLIERSLLFGRWYGKWSPSLYVLETSAIVSLVGIWAYNDHVHIMRKHPGLYLLTPDECGIDAEEE